MTKNQPDWRTAVWIPLFLALPVSAQQAESPGSIQITSDSNSIAGLSNSSERVFTYTGNVRLTQGLVEITGHEAVVTLSAVSNEVVHALISGDPVYFQRASDVGDIASASGSSQSIEYNVLDRRVVFEGNVSFSQPGISYACGRLLYSVDTNLAEGDGGCQVVIDN